VPSGKELQSEFALTSDDILKVFSLHLRRLRSTPSANNASLEYSWDKEALWEFEDVAYNLSSNVACFFMISGTALDHNSHMEMVNSV